MDGNTEQQIKELLGALDSGLAEFEDLLDEMAGQGDRLMPKLESLSREQAETRSELQEFREIVETLNEKFDRLAAVLSGQKRGAGE